MKQQHIPNQDHTTLVWFCHRCFSVAEPPVFINLETLCGLCACGVKREGRQ